MIYIVIGILIILVLVLICFMIALINVIGNQEKITAKDIHQALPYNKKLLLTKNEWAFYKKIKPIIDRNKLHILAKVRLADLVEVKKGTNKSEFNKWFSKIKSKHIDFVVCNPDNLAVLFLLELQDSTHNRADRMERDNFLKQLAETCSYKICWINNDSHLEENLQNFINALEQ